MKSKVQRGGLSKKAGYARVNMCAPPRGRYLINMTGRNESPSLCALKRGSLTIEATLVLPLFLAVILSFFSVFSQFALAADLKLQAAAEAKAMGIAYGLGTEEKAERIVICKTGENELFEKLPWGTGSRITGKAVCRAWVGFTELETEETYVYVTAEGSVYHLYRDCTHLELSVESAPYRGITLRKNRYGETYKKCQICGEEFGSVVYITSEGNRYHSARSCSGLKRTVRRIPISEAAGKSCCIRCSARGN